MEQTISKTVSMYALDIAKTYRVYPEHNEYAKYQLEYYRTKEHPRTNICVLSKNTKKFSYKIGDKVDVRQKIQIADGLWLTNVVMNKTLQKYSR